MENYRLRAREGREGVRTNDIDDKAQGVEDLGVGDIPADMCHLFFLLFLELPHPPFTLFFSPANWTGLNAAGRQWACLPQFLNLFRDTSIVP